MAETGRSPDDGDSISRFETAGSYTAFNRSVNSASSTGDSRMKDRKFEMSSKSGRASSRVPSPVQQEVWGKMRQLSEGSRECGEALAQAEMSGGGKRRSEVRLGGDYIRMQGREASKESLATPTRLRRTRKLMSWLVKNHYLANAGAIVVLLDAYLACVDIDYRALDQETPTLVVRLSDICLLMYTLELCLFLAVHGICIVKKLWRDVFFMIDVGVLLCGYVELLLSLTGMGEFFGQLGMLRLLRVARVLRLTRLLRKSTSLKELRRLLTMMATCMKALGWSFLICFAVMTFWAMLLVEIVHPIVKESGVEYFGDCTQCLRATSSVMEANLLLFKTVIAGDSWGQIAVPVIEDHPETAIIFVGSQLTLVFGVLNLIVAVVVDTFAEARQNDLVNLAEELEQDMAADQRSLQKIFNRIDSDGSGEVTLAELVEGARRDPEFRSRLQVMDIDEVDLQQLFEMIDIEGQGHVNVMEFVTPLSRWVRDSKTAPRFVKYNMMRLMRRHEEFVGSVDARFELLAVHLDEMNYVLRYLSGTSCSFDSETSTEQADLEVGHQDSLHSPGSTGAPGAMLSKQMQRLSLKHKTIETAPTTELEWVEDEMAEEKVEQPPLSKKAHLPSLHEEHHWIERETLQMQEKALASAFRNAVEVLKQSVLEATDRAVQCSLSTVDSAMKELVVSDSRPTADVHIPSLSVLEQISAQHRPEGRRPKLRNSLSMRTHSRGRAAASMSRGLRDTSSAMLTLSEAMRPASLTMGGAQNQSKDAFGGSMPLPDSAYF